MTSNNPKQVPSVPDAIPRPVTGVDRLQSLYRHEGPFTSVYLASASVTSSDGAGGSGEEPAGEAVMQRWERMRIKLESHAAPAAALKAIEARLSLPGPEHTAGVAVIAAADGTTIVDHGLEPPRGDFGVVDILPYAAPLLEWQQRRLAHLVVTVDGSGADIATFGLDHYTRLDTYQGDANRLVEATVTTAEAVDARLVLVVGDVAATGALAGILPERLPVDCRVVTEPMPADAEELAELTVRHLSDTVARATVGHLRDQRFMATHSAAVDGTAETVSALVAGTADRLLIHDDPQDQRRLWIGRGAGELSLEPVTGYHKARLVDALIRSAVLQNVPIHIIPTTGPDGPQDDLAALTGGAS